MKTRSFACLATFASVMATSQAMAGVLAQDQLCVIYDGVRGQTIDTNVVIGENWDTATRTTGFLARPAGLLKMNYTQKAGSIRAFCAEFDQALATDAVCYIKTDVADLPSTAPMGDLRAAVIANHYYHNYSSVMNDDSGNINAAFQLVLWEISEEGWDGTTLSQLNLTTGAMQFQSDNADVNNATAAMLGNLTNNPGERMALDGWTDPNSQDIITVVPGPSIALAGALGLAGLRRRRRN